MAFKTIAVALCALSACSLMTKLQTGMPGGGPASSGPSSPGEPEANGPSGAPKLVAASPGGKAPYCGSKQYSHYTAKDLHRWWDEPAEDKGRYAMHFVVKLHQALCSPDTAPADRHDIENMRTSLLAALGITDADTRDLPKLLDLETSETAPAYFWYPTEHPSAPGTAHANTTSPIDQLYMLASTNHAFYKTRWLVDVWGDTLTESARASYINLCLHSGGNLEDGIAKAINFAWCSDDIKHLDRAAYNRELAALAPEVRFTAKFELGMLLRKIATTEQEITRDPKLVKIAIETPRKIGDDWRAFAKANRRLVDNVRNVELARIDGKPTSADCRTTLAPDWKRAVATTPVEKALAPSQGIAQTSRTSYLASVGMSRCTTGIAGFEGFAEELDESIARAPMQRGPRTEAFEAAVTTVSRGLHEAAATPRMEAVDLSFLPFSQVNGHTPRFHAHTVTAVEKHGEKLKLKFKKEKVDYAVCTREEPTGNWIINGNKVVRETHCVALKAESVMEDVQPMDVSAALMSWVKVGNAVVLGTSEFPIEIWTDVHQTKLIGLYGTTRS